LHSAPLEEAKTITAERCFTVMIVKTEAFNKRVISFYESRGFVEIGKREEDVDRTRVSLVVLRLPLP
jgi:hypothetical protein